MDAGGQKGPPSPSNGRAQADWIGDQRGDVAKTRSGPGIIRDRADQRFDVDACHFRSVDPHATPPYLGEKGFEMATTRINDDAIWLKNIESGKNCESAFARCVRATSSILRWTELSAAGSACATARTVVRPSPSNRSPRCVRCGRGSSTIAARWSRCGKSSLRMPTWPRCAEFLNEWESAEDEKAYRDL